METTDLHVTVCPHDYYLDLPAPGVGLAKTATVIDALRRGAANSLLFDNGDFLQGNPMGDYIAYSRGMRPGDIHPMIAAMNAVGYDAATIGNHEFNYGLDFLMRTLAGARFPFVSANVARSSPPGHPLDPLEDQTILPPYVLLDRMVVDQAGRLQPLRIGVIGFLPPQIMIWDHKYLASSHFARDIVRAAEAWVPQIKAAGADIVIALAHSGIGASVHVEGMENACVPLARVPGIDVLLMGHSHKVFPGPGTGPVASVGASAGANAGTSAGAGVDPHAGTIFGKPAVMAGARGSHVGVVDLWLERVDGAWSVASSHSSVRAIAEVAPDGSVHSMVSDSAPVLAAVAQDHAATLAYMCQPAGHTPQPLHSYFGLVADTPVVRLVAMAQQAHIRQVLRGGAFAALPVLSAAAPFRAGGPHGPLNYINLPIGDLSLRNLAELYIYPNLIRAVKVSAAELADWLERAVGIYNQIRPGSRDATLLNPDFPSYNFDIVHGVAFQIDLSQPSRYDLQGELADPAARRILDLRFNGLPLDPGQDFIIATNDYRAHGGGAFPGARGGSVIHEGQETNRDVVAHYIQHHHATTPDPGPSWRFVPMPGTTVLFDSGPAAALLLADAVGLQIELAGPALGGFASFRIAL